MFISSGMRGTKMTNENSKGARAARREELIAACSAQRLQIGREISMFRSPNVLTGGGILESLTGGRLLQSLTNGSLKGPLAIAGVLMGLIAAKPGKFMPLVTAAVSVFKLAKTGITMLRNRAR